MQEYVQGKIASGAYANLSEVVHAGIHLLMKKDEACHFHAIKAELATARAEAESGAFETFDPRAFEPDAV